MKQHKWTYTQHIQTNTKQHNKQRTYSSRYRETNKQENDSEKETYREKYTTQIKKKRKHICRGIGIGRDSEIK